MGSIPSEGDPSGLPVSAAMPLTVGAEEVLLNKMQVAARSMLAPQVAHDLEMRTWMEMVTDHLVVELRTFILSKSLGPQAFRVIVERPATWWDHFKLALGRRGRARRWLRRHPIRRTYEVLTIRYDSAAALFPDNRHVFPKDLGAPVVMAAAQAPPYYEEPLDG